MEYLISVIIPVYNNKNTLPETLDCILRQSVYNIAQIICVDDGSTDGSDKILKDYSRSRDNITVITKENGGVSSARNKGLEYVRGKYLVFLDADDLISGDDALENLCDEMEKNNADAGIFRLMTFGFGGKEYNPVTEELVKEKTISCFDKRLLWNFPVSNKIYRSSLIKENSLVFPGTSYTEDGAFWISFVMKLQPKIIGIPSAVSMYRQSDPRLHKQATQSVKLKTVSDFIESCEIILEAINESAVIHAVSPETIGSFKDEMYLRICHILINGFYRKILRADNEFIDYIRLKFGEYSLRLPEESCERLKCPDLPEINFSKEYISSHPEVSIRVKKPSGEFLSAILLQTTPYFEICTGADVPGEFINHSKPKAKTVIGLSGRDEPDPRLISGIIKIREKFPFLPSFVLKTLAEYYLKHKR